MVLITEEGRSLKEEGRGKRLVYGSRLRVQGYFRFRVKDSGLMTYNPGFLIMS